jgi:hypothetical protein
MDRRQELTALEKRADQLPDNWVMEINPDPSTLPEPLRNREVDAVARGGDGGIVFEVVAGRRALQQKTAAGILQRLRDTVASMPGWSFELIVLPESRPPLIDESEIDQRLHAASILSDRDPAAAFLVAFSVLEWALAKLVDRFGAGYEANAQRLASLLVQLGVVGEADMLRIRSFQSMRNSVAHALDGPKPTTADIKELLALINETRHIGDSTAVR